MRERTSIDRGRPLTRTPARTGTGPGLGLVLGLLVTGCESGPARPTEYQARPVERGASYLVSSNGDPIGRIQELTIVDVEEDIRFWRVETLAGQWVGYADQWGGFFRYELFEEREIPMGLYSMKDGLAELFGRQNIAWEPEQDGAEPLR